MTNVAKKMTDTATRATRTPLRIFSPELASSRKGLNLLLLILLIVLKKEVKVPHGRAVLLLLQPFGGVLLSSSLSSLLFQAIEEPLNYMRLDCVKRLMFAFCNIV